MITIPHLLQSDISIYGDSVDPVKSQELQQSCIWKSVHSFKDVDQLFNLPRNYFDYFLNLAKHFKFDDSISNQLWSFQHYPDDAEIPADLLALKIRYILNNTQNKYIATQAIDCLKELGLKRIASHAILAKFLLELRYGG